VTSQNKDGRNSWGNFIKILWTTIGRKILSNHILANKEGIELEPTGMVIG